MTDTRRIAAAIVVALGLCYWALADDLLDEIAKPKGKSPAAADAVDDLLDRADNRTRFRLVQSENPEQGLDDLVYWRSVEGVVAAQVAPTEFRLGDAEMLAPQASQSNKGEGAEPTYPTDSRVKLPAGKFQLTPGGIPIEVRAGEATSKHPAVKVAEGKTGPEIRVLCAPVRLDAVDQAGSPVPVAIRVTRDQKSLLRKETRFNPLILWLPIGGGYDSSFGHIVLTVDGKIDAKASRLAPGVQITEDGLRRTIDTAAESAPAAESPSNLVQVTVSSRGTKEPFPSFAIFVPPVVPLAGPIHIALSKKQYRDATGEEFSLSAFSAELTLGGVPVPGAKLELQAPAGLAAPNGAADALRSQASDLQTIAISLPPYLAGPAGAIISSKAFDRARIEFLVADLGENVQLVPHRWRTVFAETEKATYQALIAGPWKAGPAELVCLPLAAAGKKGQEPIKLGQVDLPAVAKGQSDSREFTLAAGDLPCGKYQVWLQAEGQRSGRVPLEVVPWTPKSPFLLQAMSCCIPCWPLSESGLGLLESFDFQMGTATGHASLLDTSMPRISPSLAARLHAAAPNLPAELAVAPAGNDALLARLLRHKIRLIDLTTARGANFYNEGLSYHHSYQPSVDRMIRRMQLFTQQTGDYASFWGVNYNWFPALGGYVEGGVPTDSHTSDRNRALDEAVRAAGFEPISQEDAKWFAEHKTSTDAKERLRAADIVRRATDRWRAEQELGFGRHNKIYNAAVHEVRPQTVCTLFENAGHDEGKRSRALFGDMAAACYESYTDFGDWPMSSAFATDWARGNTGGQPVWLTVCWGTSPEGTMKSLLHAFARGIKGGGAPLSGEWDAAEIQQRGKGLRFVSQYGSLARDATPDGRVAILSRTCRQLLVPRGMYELHAMYYHLTRLGYPPALVSDDELRATGVPQAVKMLVLVQEQIPLEPEIAEAIAAFQQRGGKVLTVGKSTIEVAGAVGVAGDVKQLWDLGGFEAGGHAQMWQEFNEHWRGPLTEAMAKLEFEPLAAMDSQAGMALAMDARPLRYITVISDTAGTHSNDFSRPRGLSVSLEGTGFKVRDLAHQQDVKTTTKGDRTLISLDLVTEPATVLALYKQPTEKVDVQCLASPKLGADLVARAAVRSADGKSLGRVPVSCTLSGPDGTVRRQWFEAAESELRVPLAAHDSPGQWKLAVQELLTGKTAVATLTVQAAATPASVQPVGAVHVVDAGHLRSFVGRDTEKLVIVEPSQQALLPLARQLTESLNSAGVNSRLWQVAPEDFDTVPLRWYPHPDDEARLARIAAGEMIGYRGNLVAHIDKFKRSHVPELGGYAEINPPYIVGQDCIVFSGGRLAESLRSVSPWLGSPSVPGRAQGRLLVTFSPFMANRQALAVIANDQDGLAKAADYLAKAAARSDKPAPVAPAAVKLVAARVVEEDRPVDQPYREYSPQLRSAKLLANRGGRSVMLLEGQKDNLVFIDPQGKVTATRQATDLIKPRLQIDEQGRLHALVQKVLEKDPSWHFPSLVEIDSQTITPDGKLAAGEAVYVGDTASLPPDWEAGFAVSPDGKRTLASRPGALFAGTPGGAWQTYRDVDRAHWRFSVLYPRHAVGSTFSPDGRYVLFTMDSRPPFGGLGTPSYPPTASETVLWDLESGQALWRLADTADPMRAPYAVHSGFAAVARGGKLTALAGYDGSIYLIDAAGKPLIQQAISPPTAPAAGRLGPIDGVGASMSDGGELAAFAFKNLLVLAAGEKLTRVELPRVAGVAALADGSGAVVALSSGELRAFDAAGRPTWNVKSGAGTIIAAAGKDRVLAAGGTGELALLDGAGKEVWRTNVAAAADKAIHPLEPAADFVQLPPPADYLEPETLKFAQGQLKAKEITRWTPTGAVTDVGGRKFHALTGKIELAAGAAENAFVHLVYRRPASNKSLTVSVTDTGGKNDLLLDLPTPTYRVVDIPLSGKGAKVTIASDGPADVAECSLWSFAWPGPNLCYVKPAGATADTKAPAKTEAGAADLDDLLDEAVDRPAGAGAAKTCKIYCPNSDVDRVAGTYLPVPLDPTRIADGRRFEGGKLPLWAPSNSAYFPTRGAFFTIDLGKSQPIGVVATYDRSLKQSQVARRFAVFTTDGLDDLVSGKVLTGETQNDQFWRLFPLDKAKLSGFGVHIYSGASQPAGLSEVEAYR